MNRADSARKRLPLGFRLQSWTTALGTRWEIVDETRGYKVITGHRYPGSAVTLFLRHLREGIIKLPPSP